MPNKEFNNVQLDVTFIQAATRSNITSGEDIATSFGKISKWFTDLKSIAWDGHPTVTQKDTTSTVSPNHEETFTVVDSVTRNGEGHVTGINVKTVKLPTGSGYVHPTHDPHTSGLYKITVDELGHVSNASAVTKTDITDLGIPGSDTNTTYTLSGAYGPSSNTWVTTLTPSSGSATTSTVPTASTTAYGITKLSSATNSTSTSLAATASAVKAAYDKANHSHPYLPLAGGTMNDDVKIKIPRSNDGRIGILTTGGYRFKIPSNVGFAMGESWYTDEDLSNNLGGIGAYGTANDISYFYVGGTYNDPLLKVNKSDGSGVFKGSVTATKLNSSLVTSTHIAGNKGSAIINSSASAGSYTMLAKMNSTNGVFTHGSWQTKYILQYTTNTTISAGTNTVTKSVTLLDESGNSSFPGTVTATTFAGALSGNATTATTLQTARTINGVSFNGSANIIIPRSIKHIHNASGTEGSSGYVKIATIKVTGTYADHPVEFVISQRNRGPYHLYVQFNGAASTDPTLYEFKHFDPVNKGVNAYIVKSATSTWDIYIQKQQGYDHIYVLDVLKADGDEGGQYSITYTNTLVSSVPTTNQTKSTATTQSHSHPYLPLTGGTVTGKTTFSGGINANGADLTGGTTGTSTIVGFMSFKNDNSNSSPTYPYTGFYQWGSQWQVNARNSENKFVHNLLTIDNETKAATFSGSVTAPSFVGNATSATRLVVDSVTVQTGSTKKAKITLETLMSWLITKGYIPSNTNCYRVINIGWQYANNDILQLTTTTAAGTTKYELQLAGVTIEFIGSATNYNTGLFRLRIHSSPVNDNFALTSGYNRFPVSHIAEYYCNGSEYSPTWKVLSSMGDGEAYNVTQSNTVTSNYRPILMGYNNSTDVSTLTTTVTKQVMVSSSIYAQPSTGTLYASKYNGYKVGGDPGNWFSSISVIRNDGVMEAGKYIDFHTTNTGTTDYDVRLTAGSGTLTCSGSISAKSFSGNATSASKLATARTITLGSGLQGSVSFDGSANVTLNGSLKRCSFYDDASDWSKYPWRKIANIAVGGSYSDRSITFMVTNSWASPLIGILRAHIRVDGTAGVYGAGHLKWLFLTDTAGTYIKPENFVMVYTNNSGSTLGVEIWVKNTARFNGYMFTVLDESHRTAFYNAWALTTNPERAASYTSGTGVITSTVATLQNTTYTKLLYSGTGSSIITISGLTDSSYDLFTVVVNDSSTNYTHQIVCAKGVQTKYCVATTPEYNASSSLTGMLTIGVAVSMKTDTIEVAKSKYIISASSSTPSAATHSRNFTILKVYGHKYYYSS